MHFREGGPRTGNGKRFRDAEECIVFMFRRAISEMAAFRMTRCEKMTDYFFPTKVGWGRETPHEPPWVGNSTVHECIPICNE